MFIRVIVSLFSGQLVSVSMHICSTSPDKEVSGSLCQGVALLCGPGHWTMFRNGTSGLGPTSPDAPFRNIVQCPGLSKLFTMLLDKFHIGLWPSMTKLKLFPLLRHILPFDVMKTLSFIFSREDCRDFKNYPACYKTCNALFRKLASRVVCAENQIFFVDVRRVSMRHNANAICYLPFPFHGELHYPNESRVIPNVATDIIPFIFPLHRFASVDDYMVHIVRLGQRHFVAEERIQCSRRISLHH